MSYKLLLISMLYVALNHGDGAGAWSHLVFSWMKFGAERNWIQLGDKLTKSYVILLRCACDSWLLYFDLDCGLLSSLAVSTRAHVNIKFTKSPCELQKLCPTDSPFWATCCIFVFVTVKQPMKWTEMAVRGHLQTIFSKITSLWR